MAYLRNHPRSRFWIACFRDATGLIHNRSTKVLIAPPGDTPKERAEIASRNRKMAQAIADTYEETARGNVTEAQLRKVLGDLTERVNHRRIEFVKTENFLRDWLKRAAVTKSPTTLARYRGTINAFLASLKAKSQAPLGDITPTDIDAYAQERLSAGRTGSTVSVDLKTLNVPFSLAVKQGLILMNPVAASEPITGEKEVRAPFTQSEIAALLTKADREWKTAILLGAFAGLRLGDATTLKWENIDLIAKVMTLRPAKTRSRKRDLLIPLHPSLEAHLLSLAAPDVASTPICPRLSTVAAGGRRGLSKQFETLMKESGIEQETIAPAGKAGRKFNKKSFHSTRHFFITELESSGVAPDLRQKLAGHSDSKSHGRYTHTKLATLQTAICALPRLKIEA